MEPLIHIKDVTLAYDKEAILERVNLKIFQQDFIGVIGPNGGGKTTLLKAILGLLKPIQGELIFSDLIKKEKNPFGYLPQVRHIDKKFPITVFDVIRSGNLSKKRNGANKKVEKEKAEFLLEEMGISAIKNQAIGELSGGQMQRVFLCRALISDPKILILDEPDTFVDNRFEGELYEKLRVLNDKMGILLVSHDVGTISSYVKTIACVNKHLHYHLSNTITNEQLEAYNCPIQIISHGDVPHTVLKEHSH